MSRLDRFLAQLTWLTKRDWQRVQAMRDRSPAAWTNPAGVVMEIAAGSDQGVPVSEALKALERTVGSETYCYEAGAGAIWELARAAVLALLFEQFIRSEVFVSLHMPFARSIPLSLLDEEPPSSRPG